MLDVNIDRSGPVPLTIRSRRRSGGPSPTARPGLAKGCRWPRTSPPYSASIRTPCLRALHLLRDEGLLEFRRGRGITVVGTPQRGAVLARAEELLDFARHHGFGREEVIQILKSLP